MKTIPTTLSPETAKAITDLLEKAKMLLSDAGGGRVYAVDSYAIHASEIQTFLDDVGVDSDD